MTRRIPTLVEWTRRWAMGHAMRIFPHLEGLTPEHAEARMRQEDRDELARYFRNLRVTVRKQFPRFHGLAKLT